MDFLTLPERTNKNRTYGITSVTDFGIPLGELKQILDDYHAYIDIVKFGVGTAYVTPNIKDKITLYEEYNIKPYFGGTLFEKSYHQGRLDDLLTCLKEMGIDTIEVSNGTLDIPLGERLKIVESIKDEFHVIGEVGSKDGNKHMPVSEWVEEMNAFLEAGCDYVITEGRDSGTSGIYRSDGQIRSDLVNQLMEAIDVKKIIFEAPTAKSQMYFMNQVGANVNLGNVRIRDVLLVETQRKSLRSETFFMEEKHANHYNQAPSN